MRRHVLAVALSVLTLGGCSPFASDDPTTTPATSTSSTPQDRAHGIFSRDQLSAALPAPADLGSGWGAPGRMTLTEIDDLEEVDPPECAALALRGPSWDAVQDTVVGRADAKYTKGDQLASVEMRSFEEPFPPAPFDEAGSAIGRCSTWTYGSSSYRTTPLTVESFGDRSFAVRHRIADSAGGPDAYIDSLRFSVGHTYVVVAVSSPAPQTPDTAVLRQGARSVLSSLEETS